MVRGISRLYGCVFRLTIVRSGVVRIWVVGSWGGGYGVDNWCSMDWGVWGRGGKVRSLCRGIGCRSWVIRSWGRVVGSRCRMVGSRCRMVGCGMVNRCMMVGMMTISFFPGIEAYLRNGYSVTWNEWIAESIGFNDISEQMFQNLHL